MKTITSPQAKIFEFDFLRALAIIMLMFHHSEAYGLTVYGISLEGLAPYFEAILLGIFFFISGYFTERSFQKQKQSGISLFFSRTLRIFPPYLFALFLYMFVMEISLKRKDLLIYLLGAQFIFTPNFTKPVVTIWYVSAIILFYLVFGLLLANSRSARGLIVGSMLVFVVAYILHLWTGLIDERFYKYFIVFLAGILFARIIYLSHWLSGEQIVQKIILAILSSFIFSYVLNLSPISLRYILGTVLFIVSWVILLFTLATKIKTRIILKLVALISYLSYFAYLLHRPLWGWLVKFFFIESFRDQVYFKLVPASVAVFILSYFLQYGYDRLLAMFRQNKISV